MNINSKYCPECGKNIVRLTDPYCTTCYRKNHKKKAVCKKCGTLSVTVGGLCLSCYNAQHNTYKSGVQERYYCYRERALRLRGHQCENPRCPISNIEIPVKMLDVHHIDGNRKNNSLENLRILCVWCHALKTRNVEIL